MKVRDSADKVEHLLRDVLHNSGLTLTYTMTTSDSGSRPSIMVEWEGADVAMLVARNAELLLALEHLAAKMLRLEPEDHDLIRFEAGGFKAARERTLHEAAESAVRHVRESGQAYAFGPMSSHERRLLHLELAASGLRTESKGEGPHRHLVLYPGKG